jgi:hypothetical protein
MFCALFTFYGILGTAKGIPLFVSKSCIHSTPDGHTAAWWTVSCSRCSIAWVLSMCVSCACVCRNSNPGPWNTLASGNSFHPGCYLESANGKCRLEYQR